MGQSKDGGYQKLPTLSPEQMTLLQQILGQGSGNTQAAAEGYKQFLPGGGGGEAFQKQAQNNFQQQTLPSILQAFGPGSKGSTSLNQALASGASDLNTNLGAHLAGLQLNAAQGLGSLGASQQQAGLNTPAFAYQQRQAPIWQQILQAGLGTGGSLAGSYLAGRK